MVDIAKIVSRQAIVRPRRHKTTRSMECSSLGIDMVTLGRKKSTTLRRGGRDFCKTRASFLLLIKNCAPISYKIPVSIND